MISFTLNGEIQNYKGNPDILLLNYLRDQKRLTAAKDGCSPQAACGSCSVEINGRARLSCAIKMKTLQNGVIYTMEGIPIKTKEIIAKSFVETGAVQCGFCTPGFVMRTKILLQENPNPSRKEIELALKQHIWIESCVAHR